MNSTTGHPQGCPFLLGSDRYGSRQGTALGSCPNLRFHCGRLGRPGCTAHGRRHALRPEVPSPAGAPCAPLLTTPDMRMPRHPLRVSGHFCVLVCTMVRMIKVSRSTIKVADDQGRMIIADRKICGPRARAPAGGGPWRAPGRRRTGPCARGRFRAQLCRKNMMHPKCTICQYPRTKIF